MYRLSELSTDEPLVKAGCYINHFTNTQPFGICLDAPRILIPCTSLGLAFALPYVFRKRYIPIQVYNLWQNTVHQIQTKIVYERFNMLLEFIQQQFVYIIYGFFRDNSLCIVGFIKPNMMISYCLPLNTSSFEWHVINGYARGTMIYCIRPVLNESSYQLIESYNNNTYVRMCLIERGKNGQLEWTNRFHTLLHCPNGRVISEDLQNALDDITGKRLLYDSDQKRCWFFYFCNMYMNQVYYCDLKPFDTVNDQCNENQSVTWVKVDLMPNLDFVCPSSIEYSKCFIRQSVAYWFVPYSDKTVVWTLNLKCPESGWRFLTENVSLTIIDPAFDKITDDLLFYCAEVSPKTNEYPWDPCWMRIRRACFKFPTLQSLTLAAVGKHINCKKIIDKTNLIDVGFTPDFAHLFWQRVLILKACNSIDNV